jgi:hypothetical protein
LPEQYGGTAKLLLNVPQCEIDYTKNNLIEKEEDIVHFEYLMNTCEYSKPTNCREALELLKELIQSLVSNSYHYTTDKCDQDHFNLNLQDENQPCLQPRSQDLSPSLSL